MKTEMQIKHEIDWFESLLNQLRKGNYEICEHAIEAAIKMLKRQGRRENVVAFKQKELCKE